MKNLILTLCFSFLFSAPIPLKGQVKNSEKIEDSKPHLNKKAKTNKFDLSNNLTTLLYFVIGVFIGLLTSKLALWFLKKESGVENKDPQEKIEVSDPKTKEDKSWEKSYEVEEEVNFDLRDMFV